MTAPRILLALSVLGLLAACETAPEAVRPKADFAPAAADLQAFIRREMADKKLPAVSVAVLHGDDIVWARGFGDADPERGVPADASTVHRVGSVSKLFTDTAVMQLVEQGVLDLDAPVKTYLPDFAPHNPFGGEITLRELMTHFSGLVREPPVGNYFDPSEPSLAATVESLNDTELVYAPGSRLKYSNAGIAVVGRVVEVVTGEPFERYVTEHVLGPLGLERTAFHPATELRKHLAKGYMWTYDGRRPFVAPTFDLGMAPAGNLYSTAVDLVRFARSWFVRLARTGPQLLEEATRLAMYEPQFGTPPEHGIGLGYFLSQLDGHLRVGHGGAIYGFSTELAALPEEGYAVAVVTTMDFSGALPRRVADRALRWLLALHEGRQLAPVSESRPLGAKRAAALAGVYQKDGLRVRLRARGEDLVAAPPAGFRLRLRESDTGLIGDDRIAHGTPVAVADGTLQWSGQTLHRVELPKPPPVRPEWKDLIGEYGWDHNTLLVLEQDGGLSILIEWLAQYPIAERSTDHFQLPDYGLYAGEKVEFARDAGGNVTAVTVGGVRFARRHTMAGGQTFKITPVRSEADLRASAMAAQPPVQVGFHRRPDLVEVAKLDPTIHLDIRYATTNNFMGMVFYSAQKAFLQRPAAEALVRASHALHEQGYGLLIHDAYRPWFVTKMFWDATPANMKDFVANPAHGSRHNRGCAVDLTLYDLATGEPVEMVSGYDEFTARAYPRYPGGTDLERWHRQLLHEAMSREGFEVYEYEWWHFDYRDWQQYGVLNTEFR